MNIIVLNIMSLYKDMKINILYIIKIKINIWANEINKDSLVIKKGLLFDFYISFSSLLDKRNEKGNTALGIFIDIEVIKRFLKDSLINKSKSYFHVLSFKGV